jgi:hypothetical protein
MAKLGYELVTNPPATGGAETLLTASPARH